MLHVARPSHRAIMALGAAFAASCAYDGELTTDEDIALATPDVTPPTLLARAVLPAETYARGPTSGAHLGAAPINGVPVPFVDKQPIQGISALVPVGDGTYYAMPDNGFGTLETSADFRLRVYRVRPR